MARCDMGAREKKEKVIIEFEAKAKVAAYEATEGKDWQRDRDVPEVYLLSLVFAPAAITLPIALMSG